MNVREVQASDEPAILALYRDTPELHQNAVVDFLDEDERKYALTKKHKLFLVAEDNNELVGFAYVDIKHQRKSPLAPSDRRE